MPLESKKTRQHLRDQVVIQGEQERLRAMQSLSHGYGTGSKAALASLLMAALGGANVVDELLVDESDEGRQPKAVTLMGQVSKPMQNSSNDAVFDTLGATTQQAG